MLYESDVSDLLEKWKNRLSMIAISQEYKDGIRDCMYDLKNVRDKQFEEEALAQESFEQRIKEDASIYDELEQMLNNCYDAD